MLESYLENTASLKNHSSYGPQMNYNICTLSANTGIMNLHNHKDGIITYFLQSPLLSDWQDPQLHWMLYSGMFHGSFC